MMAVTEKQLIENGMAVSMAEARRVLMQKRLPRKVAEKLQVCPACRMHNCICVPLD